MKIPNMGEPSAAWPYIKAVAKFCKIPGTEIGFDTLLKPLVELQDDLAQDHYQDQIKELLQAISGHTSEIARQLLEKGAMEVRAEDLRSEGQELAEWIYLKRVANKFYYADFRGMQESKFVSLLLDDIFVDLKVVPEDREFLRRLHGANSPAGTESLGDLPLELLAGTGLAYRNWMQVSDGFKKWFGTLPAWSAAAEATGESQEFEQEGELQIALHEARPPGQVLAKPGTCVFLGGPGSGKTTLVKRLARSCALGRNDAEARFPGLPWCFPVVVPITQHVDSGHDKGLLSYVEKLMTDSGGEALLVRYREHFAAGRVLLLLDGLDEVADPRQRNGAAKAVDEVALNLLKNRLLVTSRRVGYAVCRLSVPADHYVVAPFSPQDITTFVDRWYAAMEKQLKQEKADLRAAQLIARELNDEISRNPNVASLATNPLMLTIIALIKHRKIGLPQRRVELYRIALETLLESWNLARSLAQVQMQLPAGETPRIEQTREVWSHIALWMHQQANRVVRRTKLHQKLVDVLVEHCDKTEFDAEAIAGSYLDTAAENSGLLEPRGPDAFAFVHQSFQEYLAAFRLSRPASKVLARLREHYGDPRWHEVIRLCVGHLSIVVGEKELVAEIVDDLLQCKDPLEPLLGNALRLALGLLADQVELRQKQVDAVLLEAARLLNSGLESWLKISLLSAVDTVEIPPGPGAFDQYVEFALHADTDLRVQALRLVSLSAACDEGVLERLRPVLEDNQPLVKAQVAWLFWVKGTKSDDIVRKILAGYFGGSIHMTRSQAEVFYPAVLNLLGNPGLSGALPFLEEHGIDDRALPKLCVLAEGPDKGDREKAVGLLLKSEKKEVAEEVLHKALKDPDVYERLWAASQLGGLGRQREARPVLVECLTDRYDVARGEAARILGDWGPAEEIMPGLLRLLSGTTPRGRTQAVRVFKAWGPNDKAAEPLRQMLLETDPRVRLSAASALSAWGEKTSVRPILLDLLSNFEFHVRAEAVNILGELGPNGALRHVQALLLDDAPFVRMSVAKVLSGWGLADRATPTLLELIRGKYRDSRAFAHGLLRDNALKERYTGKATVVEAILSQLEWQISDRLRSAFQCPNRAENPFASVEIRKELADLFSQTFDHKTPEYSFRSILFEVVWRWCASTA